jgi:hypothetical protein
LQLGSSDKSWGEAVFPTLADNMYKKEEKKLKTLILLNLEKNFLF